MVLEVLVKLWHSKLFQFGRIFTKRDLVCKSKGKRAQYYMSIMNEAYSKMRKNGESDQSFKNRFTAERSRQFDLLQSKESVYQNADGCSKRACEFLKPGYQLKPSDGRRLNSSIKEHQSMLGKLKSVVKALKEHDSTLFQSNGLILKQGEEFAHDFNVKQIKCVEAKVQKVTRETETLEESKDSFRGIFKGLHGDRISKGKRKKENRRKSNARKKKRFENNVQRVYSICAENPLGNYLSKCLLYPPCLAVPEGCIDVEKVSELLLIEMRHTLHSSCKETISATPQEAELSQTSSRRLEITCIASCTLKSML